IVALITWYLRRGLPESKIWSEDNERRKKEGKKAKIQMSGLKELFSLKVNRQALFLLIGIYIFSNITAGAMGYFMPYINENVVGLSNCQANLLQALLWMFTVITTFFGFMKLGDKVSQRFLFGLGGVVGLVAWCILTFMPMNWVSLILFVVLWGSAAGI